MKDNEFTETLNNRLRNNLGPVVTLIDMIELYFNTDDENLKNEMKDIILNAAENSKKTIDWLIN